MTQRLTVTLAGNTATATQQLPFDPCANISTRTHKHANSSSLQVIQQLALDLPAGWSCAHSQAHTQLHLHARSLTAQLRTLRTNAHTLKKVRLGNHCTADRLNQHTCHWSPRRKMPGLLLQGCKAAPSKAWW
jgi:hypothetical protein